MDTCPTSDLGKKLTAINSRAVISEHSANHPDVTIVKVSTSTKGSPLSSVLDFHATGSRIWAIYKSDCCCFRVTININ